MTEKESFKFEMSDDLLLITIKQQAGKPKKGFMEAIQNAVDSGAKKIKVVIKDNFFSIEDNGCGMDRNIIDNYFRYFGKSIKRESGDKRYIGTFGIGRGQYFAMGVCEIHTLNNLITVDINKKIGYEIETVPTTFAGTKIEIKLFDEKIIHSWQINSMVQELLDSFLLTDVELEINEKTNPKIDPTVIKQFGIIKAIEGQKESKLFVKGVYIRNIDEYIADGDYNVICDELTLNTARNEEIHDEIYQKFMEGITLLNKHIVENHDRRKSFDNPERLLDLYRKKVIAKEDLMNIKFVHSYEGDVHYTPKFLLEAKHIANVHSVSSNRRYQFANEYKNLTGQVVVDLDSDTESFIRELGVNVLCAEKNIEIVKKIHELLDKGAKKVNEDETSKINNVYFMMVRWYGKLISKALREDERTISFVENAAYNAHTDGSSIIDINTSQINKSLQKHVFVAAIYHLLIHEYSHHNDDQEGDHPAEFFERFHKNCMNTAVVLGTIMRVPFGKIDEEE